MASLEKLGADFHTNPHHALDPSQNLPVVSIVFLFGLSGNADYSGEYEIIGKQ